ncbi:MAG: hypothetical protein ACK5E6_06160, partial [Cyanobacteriota bacterium]
MLLSASGLGLFKYFQLRQDELGSSLLALFLRSALIKVSGGNAGYNLGIIDDPYKGPEDAKSALQRDRLIDWLKSVWSTRAEPGQSNEGLWLPAAQVVVQTRWDHQDMTAWLLEQESQENPEHWTVLS